MQNTRTITIAYFWSYGPLKWKIAEFAFQSGLLCNLEIVEDIMMKLHKFINQHETEQKNCDYGFHIFRVMAL